MSSLLREIRGCGAPRAARAATAVSRLLVLGLALAVACGRGSNAADPSGAGGTGGAGAVAGTGVVGGAGGDGRGGAGGGGVGGGVGGGGAGGVGTGGTAGVYHLHAPADHRAQGTTCSTDRGLGGAGGAPGLCGGSGGVDGSPCTGLNAACCHYSNPFMSGSYCAADGCSTDDDCGASQVCLCNGRGSGACTRNVCAGAGCRIDSDCGPGLYCSWSRPDTCSYYDLLRCHTPDDECADSSDCVQVDGGSPQVCAYREDIGRWRCGPQASSADCYPL